MQIAAGVFKAKCLRLMDDVRRHRCEIVITKHGRPVAKMVPVKGGKKKAGCFGMLRGSVKINGDIVGASGASWEADEG